MLVKNSELLLLLNLNTLVKNLMLLSTYVFFFFVVLSSSSSYVVSSSPSSCAHVFEAKSRQDEKKTKSPTHWQIFLLELCLDPSGSDYVADESLKPHNQPASFQKFLIEGSVC